MTTVWIISDSGREDVVRFETHNNLGYMYESIVDGGRYIFSRLLDDKFCSVVNGRIIRTIKEAELG